MSQGSAPSRDEPRLPAGRVGRPHGLDGSFYVTEARPALLAVGATVMVEGRELRITRRAGADARPIVALEGASRRNRRVGEGHRRPARNLKRPAGGEHFMRLCFARSAEQLAIAMDRLGRAIS